MVRNSPDSNSLAKIEKDFLDALDRLREGLPTNRKLKALQKRGALKINISNVAIEAGRSRTLIGMDGCRFQRVRELIKGAREGKEAVPTTHSQLIHRLRLEIATLTAQKELFQAEATAHFIARKKAEAEAERERAISGRLRQELATLGKVIALVPKD